MDRKELNSFFMKGAGIIAPMNSCIGCDKSYCCKGQRDIAVTGTWIEEIKSMITTKQRERFDTMRDDGLIDCPFNREDGKCEIYDHRPFVCASYHVLESPERCNTDLVKEEISMIHPAATLQCAMDLGRAPFTDQLKKEFDSGNFSILDAFKDTE